MLTLRELRKPEAAIATSFKKKNIGKEVCEKPQTLNPKARLDEGPTGAFLDFRVIFILTKVVFVATRKSDKVT